MGFVKKLFKWVLYLLIPIIAYLIIALTLSAITINRTEKNIDNPKTVYLNTNGVHLNIILPISEIDTQLLDGLVYNKDEKYFSFGWGDKNFYINTPTWADLTFKNAFKALFLKTPTLMHVTRYKKTYSDWIPIRISEIELTKLNNYILKSFKTDDSGNKILLEGVNYSDFDAFYKAKGSYSALKTSNTWVNSAFKESGLKSSFWTPFDFGLINKYK